MSLQYNAKNHREYLTCGSHGRQDERVEIRDRVKDEGLSDRRTQRELDDLTENFGVGGAERQSRSNLVQPDRDDDRRQAHVQVCPEHEIVRLGLDPGLGRLALKLLLEAGGDPVQHETHDDVRHAQHRTAPALLLPHGNYGRAPDDGG